MKQKVFGFAEPEAGSAFCMTLLQPHCDGQQEMHTCPSGDQLLMRFHACNLAPTHRPRPLFRVTSPSDFHCFQRRTTSHCIPNPLAGGVYCEVEGGRVHVMEEASCE